MNINIRTVEFDSKMYLATADGNIVEYTIGWACATAIAEFLNDNEINAKLCSTVS